MRTKWIYTILVLVLGFFVSCSNEVDNAGMKKTRTVIFRLSVDDAVGSRAEGDWSTNDNPVHGTTMENRIDLKGLRVAIYSIKDGKADTKVGEADNLLYWSINESSDTNDPIEYQLVGDISEVELVEGTDYRFMVYANFPNTTNNLFDLEDIDVNSGYIPMWGVITHPITGAELEDLGTIDLLRAAAKVEVTFASGVTDNYTVSGLAVKNYNETGNNLPNGWNSAINTKALDMEDCIHATGDHVHGSNLSFLINKDNNDKYYIYIPEYRNTAHLADDQSVVVITLTDNTDNTSETYEIPFCNYVGGSPVVDSEYDIVRNHIYQFNVTGVKPKEGRLLLNFKVADWEDGAAIDLGSLVYPTYVNPVLPSKDFNYLTTDITKEPKMKYVANDTSESFEMYFHFISANESSLSSYVWRPTIVERPSTSYDIRVYEKGTIGDFATLVYEKKSTAQTASIDQLNLTDGNYKGWFKIVVTPTAAVEFATVFKFGISCGVHPSGFPSDDFFLFINGENDKIAWPNSGSDRKFIEITQVVE